MRPKLIKYPAELYKLVKTLRPNPLKILLYFLLTHEPFTNFKMTFYDITKETGIKNAYVAVKELEELGHIDRVSDGKNGTVYCLLIDIIR